MGVTSGGRGQNTDASRDDALYGLSGLRVLDKGCIFDALLDLIAFGHRAFPRGNGFVNVNGHAEVMSERRLVTRIFFADSGGSSGVHLQRADCRFTRFLCDPFVTLVPKERSPTSLLASGSEGAPFWQLVRRLKPSSIGYWLQRKISESCRLRIRAEERCTTRWTC